MHAKDTNHLPNHETHAVNVAGVVAIVFEHRMSFGGHNDIRTS